MKTQANGGYAEVAEFTVVDSTIDTLQIEIQLNPAADLLKEHFAGFPVVPGVIQLSWIFDFGRQLLARTAVGPDPDRAYTIRNLKFRAPMIPRRAYHLRIDRHSQGFEFSIVSGQRPVSSGLVVYDR